MFNGRILEEFVKFLALSTMSHYIICQLFHQSFHFQDHCTSPLRSMFLIYRATWEKIHCLCDHHCFVMPCKYLKIKMLLIFKYNQSLQLLLQGLMPYKNVKVLSETSSCCSIMLPMALPASLPKFFYIPVINNHNDSSALSFLSSE